ncbi:MULTISPECIES: SMP-30/gluconolactonase/LRE family protein [unclassified Pseudomonas]|uniref:SMP-30/gluconolactonase/LRE family protein n=1 Tax=unclassified Pseudomonas TaxID=196821 RepID=UPI0005B9C92F|nr:MULTISPECIES: SMP-30/gluconolactonase/LRE family protein [unclassified Pseudomonas]MBB1609138.1 gluconolactonase [Pseudomonas sp. UMC76]MBB1636846.1 gluconolactonase [Pseudomonas sp. UME83]NTX90905.1 SMP-30/gluconolactonase/LRE family protein [Pseudomonas sp. UMA643]NTY17548.1 SMP-30/gluconolactonase/LRE family protein [Pseudomonas sp. UMC3103]NTY23118.1 SMP-30/gluconolactonase/LRE family protein [Pseudomonas sp. UMA603]
MKKFASLLVLLIAAAAVYLAITPSPIDPVAWNPPPAPPMTGVLEPNDTLMKAELLGLGQVKGPEDTAVDAQGRVYAGLDDGRVVRLDNGQVTTFAETGGRPLGMDFDAQGNLIVADAWKGLLKIDAQGKITVLSTEADGVPFAFADDLDIASDGRIYFSDASSRFHQPDYILDYLETRPHGRLLRYDPATGKTETLLKDLYFANGVTLSANEDFVLVNETYRYRIARYWLKGPKAGQQDIFIDNLPGLPDNLQGDRKGTFWVALPTPRKADADFILAQPWLKRQLTKLPRALLPKPVPYGLVIAVDENGQIVRSLHDTSGQHLRMITSAKPVGDYLYFGSLENDRIGRLKIR